VNPQPRPEAVSSLLAAYPVIIELPVLWGDMDAFEHVNNVAYFRYFENARIAFMKWVGLSVHRGDAISATLGSAHCRFKAPLVHPDAVSIGTRGTVTDECRITLEFAIASHELGRIAAEGGGDLVTYDFQSKRKVPVPAPVRLRLAAAP
jgi:acyl-CoA thioester hydrolase